MGKGGAGADCRIYPWGNQWDATRCNSRESGLEKTVSVHGYPLGATPYGVLDMAGNVWEWTRSLWGTSGERPDYRYPYKVTDERENLDARHGVGRAMRGGSFGNSHRRVGFRVVVRPPL